VHSDDYYGGKVWSKESGEWKESTANSHLSGSYKSSLVWVNVGGVWYRIGGP
jgi:hypothetical protein